MRLRDILPRAGWTMIAFAGLGAGATVALVTDVSGRSSSAEPVTASSQRDLATAHCRVAAVPAQAQSPEASRDQRRAGRCRQSAGSDAGACSHRYNSGWP